ncbi:DUF1203 domain-containing protein [Phytohabitans houttuyneae]|uniref:DUF1203 domain-containing protein n=1 Tax=Phytohabitans houttuyneae TaxID=1076126 RepID=A0A6V8K194_9ACTN|nr:DUF1203 domain-containing protein [Phytohabitans houttuyneae]GFJ75939.1 hypothetical protein Phou_001190 [Phytohabitans houttuyneae]
MTYEIHALPAALLDTVRASGLDASGNPVERVTATGGEPVRCCLRDAAAGEELMLFGYEPPLPPSPYREVGAVFAHAERCAGPDAGGYPEGWRGRSQVLRAYDARAGSTRPRACTTAATRGRDREGARRAGRRAGAQPQRRVRLLHVHGRTSGIGRLRPKSARGRPTAHARRRGRHRPSWT